tara:strand:+ start:299 stop:1753 length:1455 start_codon:yes stop_codon:yes gene_type:complete
MAASDNTDKIINYAGDFRAKLINIISYRPAEGSEKAFRFDVLNQCMMIQLVEDITMPAITGSLDIADGQDIRTLLPITGNERLELHCFTPGQDEIRYIEGETDTLNIYKVEKIRISGGTARQQVYRLHFTSREAVRNSITRISKAFEGPVENAVNEILTDEKYLDSRKLFVAEPTATNTKYVIPNLKPFKAIKFLADHSVAGNYKNAGYFFYETTSGYKFRSIESMMALSGTTARTAIEKYAMQPAKMRTQKGDIDVQKDLQSPDSYVFENVVNTLEELNKGLFANRLITHDIFNKKIETHDFDYHESFGEFFHLEHDQGARSTEKFMRPLSYFETTSKTFSDFPEAKIMNMVETSKVHNDFEFTPVKDILPNKVSQRAQMANFHLILSVPGQTRINCGEIITFALPDQRPVAHDDAQKLNPYYSGRYLILSVKHKFDLIQQKHMMNLRCVKDSVATELPKGLEELVTLPEKSGTYSQYDFDDL